MLKQRLSELLVKLVGYKTIVLGLATWLLMLSKIDGWMWFAIASTVLGSHEVYRYFPIKNFLKNKGV